MDYMPPQMGLEELRREIDAVDDELMGLFVKRMELSRRVAEYKKENGIPVLNAKREADILRRMSEKAGPVLDSYADGFFNNLFDLSRSYQSSCSHKYGLVGGNLSYSYSKLIHEKLGDYKYELFSLDEDAFENQMARRDFDGLNVTIPYKRAAIPYCDEVSKIAREIGAVNTVYKNGGELIGTNTDYDGFLYMLGRSGISLAGKKILILGAGGASLTVQKCARDAGASEISIARRGHDFSKDRDAEIIVNSTPVGTFPGNGEKLIELADFPKCEGVIDLIYNPLLTDLLLRAKEYGVPYSNGLPMLVAQATAAAELFTGKGYSGRNEEIISDITASVQNIVLIGMPGSGKTTLGMKLAGALGKGFLDMDEAAADRAGMGVPEIFEKYGEEHFRDLETEIAKEYGKQQGRVIATGGGCVLRRENMDALAQNGAVVFLERPLAALDRKGRPLSKDLGVLQKMHEERLPLYEKYGDYRLSYK